MTQDASTMPSPAAAVHDAARLDALRASGLLDSAVEEQFDRLTRLASKLLRAPATFFSLVDADRDFYKSCFGFPEPLASGRELTGATFCHYSLVSDGALVIPDTRADPVYARVPTVESLGVAAYLGVPVRAPGGEVLGSFCAIDFTPRAWTPLEIDTMKELATSAEREVAIRHWMREQAEQMRRERDARLELENVMESRASRWVRQMDTSRCSRRECTAPWRVRSATRSCALVGPSAAR
jgi:GAF domain-containing protein